MRIKQKELIGKVPQVTYTETLPNQLKVIVQVFDNPKCVNMIKLMNEKVIERQCYLLNDMQYQTYINNYKNYGAHSQVDGLFANSMANKANKNKDSCMRTFWVKLRNYVWR